MKTSIKSLIRFSILILLIHSLNQSFGQVGINNLTPNVSSMLDITSTNKGVLIPRMTSFQRLAIPTPATGLMVYETTTNQFFYFDGTVWRPMAANNSAWNTLGNSGTSAATNFIGTTDLNDFTIRTNNTENMRIKSTGNVGIGTSVPSAKLSVQKSGIDDILTLGDNLNSIMVGTDFDMQGFMRIRTTSGTGLAITNNGDAIGLFVKADATANVGIGTTAPTDKLHVDGNIRMVDGNQGAGKVMVSDANGKASWQDKITKFTSVTGTTTATAPVAFGLMDQMSITFTAKNNIVLAQFNAAGANVNSCGQRSLHFQVRLNGTVIQVTQTSIEDVANSTAKVWDISIEIPVNVVPGTSNTISIFWSASGCTTPILNGPLSAVAPDGSYRVLTLVEP